MTDERVRARNEEIAANTAEALRAVDAAQDNPNASEVSVNGSLPDGYHLIVALRETGETCKGHGGDPDHEDHPGMELAILTGPEMDPETTLSILSSAMRRVGDSAGIAVGLVDPRQLAGLLAASMMAGRGMPDRPSDDAEPVGTGQYL
jgi:hypothetical protein